MSFWAFFLFKKCRLFSDGKKNPTTQFITIEFYIGLFVYFHSGFYCDHSNFQFYITIDNLTKKIFCILLMFVSSSFFFLAMRVFHCRNNVKPVVWFCFYQTFWLEIWMILMALASGASLLLWNLLWIFHSIFFISNSLSIRIIK